MSKIVRTAILFLSLMVTGQASLAATVAEEKQRLSALQQSLSTRQASLQEMQAELEAYPAKLQMAEDELKSAEAELQEEERELAKIQAELQANPSTQAERELNLQELAVRMAQRGVRSEDRVLERFTRYRDTLREDIANAEKAAAQLQERIRQQERRVELAETEAREPKPETEVKPTRQTKVAEPTPPPRPEPEPAVVAAPPPPEPAGPLILPRETFEAFELARDTMKRVEELLAQNTGSGGRELDLKLTGSDIEDVPFEHLGANQYRAKVALPSGPQRFRIDDLRFRATIATENAGETYVFMVDAADRRRLKATYFQESLLDYIGRNPVAADAVESEETEEANMQAVELPSGQTVELSEEDAYSLEIAMEHQALVKELQQEQDNEDPFFSGLTLSGNLLETTAFEYLGHGLYLAESSVQAGRQNIKVNRGNFRIEIPDTDDGEVYLFYVDASRPTRLRLTYYKKSILDYLK